MTLLLEGKETIMFWDSQAMTLYRVMTGMTYSQSYPNQPGIATDGQVRGWQAVMDTVHAAGGKIMVQLMHSGALSQGNHYRDRTIAPSQVQPKGQKMEEYGGGGGPFPLPHANQSQRL